MGAWEVEYFHAVVKPVLGHWTSKGLHIDCSRYTGLSNDSVCDSLAPVILSDDDPSRGIGRLVTEARQLRPAIPGALLFRKHLPGHG